MAYTSQLAINSSTNHLARKLILKLLKSLLSKLLALLSANQWKPLKS